MPNAKSLVRRTGAILLIAALPLACSQAADVVATVNGNPIHRSDIKQYQQEHGMGATQAQDEQAIIDELIARELVYQDAVSKNLGEKPEVKQAVEDARRKVLLSAAVQQALAENPVTDKEMQAVYDEKISQLKATEYKARHILVKEESEAEQIIDQLEGGAEFAALAETHSTGPSGEKGGDLGWFSPEQMVPAFSEAVQKLEKGEFTKEPVKSRFGWHVIKLEDTRAQQPPSFEEVKPQLQQALSQKHVADYLASLKQDAEIDIKP